MLQGYQEIDFHIRGVAPLFLHNRRLANPRDPIVKQMKKIFDKQAKKRTDEDLIELSRLEFMGGLYLDEDNRVVMPGENIEGMLLVAAKRERKGDAAKAGIISDGFWRLIYQGPTDPDKLWSDGRFSDTRGACPSGTTTVQRTRPIFPEWELKFKVHHLTELVDKSRVVDWMELAGRLIGLGDYRPRHGRFTVVSVS